MTADTGTSAGSLESSELAAYRKLFPVIRTWTYLQHASIGPVPTPVLDAAQELLASQAQSGTEAYDSWLNLTRAVRGRAATFLNSSAEEISFVRNTADGLARIAYGLSWRAGDNIVTDALEYPTNVLPWLALREQGVETRVAPETAGRVLFESLVNMVDRRTKLVAVSSVQFSNGYRLDLSQLSAFCRQREILLSVDAIQQLGVLPMDVRAVPVDFISAGGHKWLLSPCGVGLFYCRRDLLDRLRVVELGAASTERYSLDADFLEYDGTLRANAQRFEGGVISVSGLAGMGAALDLLLQVGLDRISQHVLALTDSLTDGLSSLGFHVLSPRASVSEKSGIVSFNHPRIPAKEIKRYLTKRAISVSLRLAGGTWLIRVSPHFYNTEEEIELLLASLREIVKASIPLQG